MKYRYPLSSAFFVLSSSGLISVCFAIGNLFWVSFFSLIPLFLIVYKTKNKLSLGISTGIFAALLTGASSRTLWQEAAWSFFAAMFLHMLVYFILGFLISFLQNSLHKLAGFCTGWVIIESLMSDTGLWKNFSSPISLGYALADSPLVYVAKVSGLSTLSFFVIVVNLILFLVLIRKILAGTVLAVITVGFSILTAHDDSVVVGDIKIAAIQGGISEADRIVARFDKKYFDYVLGTYIKLSREAKKQAPNLIVWPEASFPKRISWRNRVVILPDAFQQFPSLLFGASYESVDAVYNSAVFWNGKKLNDVYYKRYPVPLLEDWAKPGLSPGIFSLGLNRIGIMICSDSIYRNSSRDLVNNGAQVLVVMANTNSGGDDMHLRTSAVRAAETGRDLVQVSQRATSVFFDHRGKQVYRFNTNSPLYKTQKMILTNSKTLFLTFGDWGSRVLMLIFISLFLANYFWRESATKIEPPILNQTSLKLASWFWLALIFLPIFNLKPNSSYWSEKFQSDSFFKLGWRNSHLNSPTSRRFFTESKFVQLSHKQFFGCRINQFEFCGVYGVWDKMSKKELLSELPKNNKMFLLPFDTDYFLPITATDTFVYGIHSKFGYSVIQTSELVSRVGPKVFIASGI